MLLMSIVTLRVFVREDLSIVTSDHVMTRILERSLSRERWQRHEVEDAERRSRPLLLL